MTQYRIVLTPSTAIAAAFLILAGNKFGRAVFLQMGWISESPKQEALMSCLFLLAGLGILFWRCTTKGKAEGKRA